MATYVNNLRLKEITTGAESGTWGTSTNTNLELIADAFGSGTEAITTNADTHTTTVADGAADEGRAIYMKYTGTLDSVCTITLAPDTINKFWIIENATSGSQDIRIKQGSGGGAYVTIGNGNVSAIFTDGAGSGAVVYDALADLELSATFTVAGNVDFNGDLDVDGTSNLDVVDIDGAVDMASTLAVAGVTTLGGRIDHKTGSTLAAQYGSGGDIGLNTSSAAADFNIKCVGEFAVSAGASSTTNFLIAGTAASFMGTLDVTGTITGNLTGNVTGNTSGTAATVTGSAQSAITSVGTLTSMTTSGDVIIGTNPSSAGDIRLNKNFQIFTRNNANDANKAIISENIFVGNDTLDFGDNTKWAALRFHVSALNVMILEPTLITLNKNVTASGTLTVTGNAMVGNTVTNPVSGYAGQSGIGITAATGNLEASANNSIPLELGRYGGFGSMQVFRYANTSIGNFSVSTGPVLNLELTGDLGVGTAPSNRLHVKETGMTGWLAKLESNNTSANDVSIEMCYSGSGGGANSGMNIAMDYATGTSDYVLLCSSGGSPRFKVNAGGLVHVAGELTAGTKTFRIDHPLADKKDTHQLVHSCIEAPKADLIYRGTVDLSSGSAQVDLDEAAGMSAGTWELLCRDPQCWIQNDSGWSGVRGSVEKNTLTIKCEDTSSSDSVSWMVVAERQDESIKGQEATDSDGHLIVEPEKEDV